MIADDPNLHIVELAAQALEPLLDEVVLVGGCAVGLLITDRARPPVRHTVDIDLLAEITTRANYYQFCDRLRQLGFVDNRDVICRFSKDMLIVDLMPTDAEILNFGNVWYDDAVRNAVRLLLPSGRAIRHITAPLLLGTKLEAFHGRAGGDFMHHDLEDIINLVDGRPEIVQEVANSASPLKAYIQSEFDDLLANTVFTDAIPRHFHPDRINQARVPLVIERLRELAGI